MGDAPFSRQKSSRVSRLVRYGAYVGFCARVYGMCWHACVRMSQSPSKHYTRWYVMHRRGNRCHLVTQIRTITPRWLWTQYDSNMHLQQSPWAHTHAIRSRALMARKGQSPTHTQAYRHTHTHTHTYIMHNAITHSRKIKKTLSTFQGYGLTRYRKCKTNIVIPKKRGPSKD